MNNMNIEMIQANLKTAKLGKNILYFNDIDSTNDIAKKLAKEGETDGTVIIAEAQKQGRGRQGNSWLSPP
jgi:BirA family biotin operon repressor/biotin-[acetyl-CoA-carboxylase] ligase